LTLGLILVVGIMLLLLGGTLDGMLSYRGSMKAIQSKLFELQAVAEMQVAVNSLYRLVDDGKTANPQDVLDRIGPVQNSCREFESRLNLTVSKGWDPNDGKEEYAYLESMRESLQNLQTLANITEPQAIITQSTTQQSPNQERILKIIKYLNSQINELSQVIYRVCVDLKNSSSDDEKATLALAIGTSVLGCLLMVALSWHAYRWLVDPIRELHEKVCRLAQGNFDSRIVVKSNDEIQDLAEAFNNMTERLQTIYRDLEHQVNERSRQLVRSESLAGVGFLAAGVAHEINNPLASIAFCGEALERRLRELLAGKRDHPDMVTVNNYLRMIQDEAFRCKDITQKLLEFSRIGERQRQMTDLAQIIQSVIDMVHLHQAYKGKNIVFDPIRNPTLLVNDQEIKSVVLNLVANALDSMNEGGTLTITLDSTSGNAVMTFTDTGCGMGPEVMENLFEPFFSRSRTGKGIGLGLSISHRIITQHGGEIEATSPGPDQGSTFTVRLPLTPAMTAEQPRMAMAA
jgi:signal transduction histidine kinase